MDSRAGSSSLTQGELAISTFRKFFVGLALSAAIALGCWIKVRAVQDEQRFWREFVGGYILLAHDPVVTENPQVENFYLFSRGDYRNFFWMSTSGKTTPVLVHGRWTRDGNLVTLVPDQVDGETQSDLTHEIESGDLTLSEAEPRKHYFAKRTFQLVRGHSPSLTATNDPLSADHVGIPKPLHFLHEGRK